MRGKRHLVVTGLVVGLLALLALACCGGRRARLTPEAQVQAQVQRFCELVEKRRPADAGRLLAPNFTWEGSPKSDFMRGLLMVLRDYDRLLITIDGEPQVQFDDPACEQGTVRVRVAVSGWRGQAETTVGMDEPVTVEARVARVRGGYRFVSAQGGRRFESGL